MLKMFQKEIDGFLRDGENRKVYLHLREEVRPEIIARDIAFGTSISGGGEAHESYDKISPNLFSWQRHFSTSRANFLKVAELLSVDLIPITREDLEESIKHKMGTIEKYHTNIPYLIVESYRAYENRETVGLENLSQVHFLFSLNNDKLSEILIPEEFMVDAPKLDGIVKANKELQKNWQEEFSEANWMKTFIIKLHRLICLSNLISEASGDITSNDCFTVWLDDERAYRIYLTEYGFDKGLSRPLTYEEVIDTLFEYDNCEKKRDVVQRFTGEWYYDSRVLGGAYLSEIKKILLSPIPAEEYAKAEEILEESHKNTARGWLKQIEEDADAPWRFYRPTEEKYIKKAQDLWPEIDISDAKRIIEDIENEKNTLK